MPGDLSFQQAVNLSAALSLSGVGATTLRKALALESDVLNVDKFVKALKSTASSRGCKNISNDCFNTAIDNCWDAMEAAKNDGQSIITILDENYPNKLKDLSDPPIVLFAKGNTGLLNSDKLAIAVVGSRKACEHGLEVSKRIGEILAEKEIIVISGLAIGCDTFAHAGCLEKDGLTIAVLPSPLNNIVPEQNNSLAESILLHDGLLISEQLPNAVIDKSAFVSRNRIQAALSDKVIVVETAENGGTMRTVDFANKLTRSIGAYSFPKQYQTTNNSGNEYLIKEGMAIPISDIDGIESFLSYTPAQLSLF